LPSRQSPWRFGDSLALPFTVEEAKPGTVRVTVEVRAGYLSQPLQEEQASRVVGK